MAYLGHITHTYHDQLIVPEVDIVIFSGDATNPRDIRANYEEYNIFLHWFALLPIKHKILIGGNHDITLEKNTLNILSDLKDKGIAYLENDFVIIEDIKIWGSPFSPSFNNWSFMKARHKLGRLWQHIPADVDIVITHTPPKGVLDLTYDLEHKLIYCGCNALKKRILEINPKLHLFGHIHNNKDVINAATTKLSCRDTIFSNGSVVTDRKFGTLSSNGNILTI